MASETKHSHSADCREWAKLSTLKAGDKIKTDDGFTCGINNKVLEVKEDAHGDLYVECDDGHHGLDGQADDGDHLVGMSPPNPSHATGTEIEYANGFPRLQGICRGVLHLSRLRKEAPQRYLRNPYGQPVQSR